MRCALDDFDTEGTSIKGMRGFDSPIEAKTNHKPNVDIVFKVNTELVEKRVEEKPGIRPSTVGPRMIPASISATTDGCLKKLRM